MSNTSEKNKSELYCTTVAKSISDIIRFSLDEEFRSQAFEIFKTESTKDTEAKVYEKLLDMLEYGEEKKNENCVQNGKFEKLEKGSDSTPVLTSQDMNTPSTSTQSSDSQSLFSPALFRKRNWFKISSERYKENLKRRKIQFFSQPLANTFVTDKPEILRSSTQIPKFFQSDWETFSTYSLSQHSVEDSEGDDEEDI